MCRAVEPSYWEVRHETTKRNCEASCAWKNGSLTPPSSIALGQYIGSSDYTLRSFPVGHIGMYVSGKVQRDLPPLIAQWVKERG